MIMMDTNGQSYPQLMLNTPPFYGSKYAQISY